MTANNYKVIATQIGTLTRAVRATLEEENTQAEKDFLLGQLRALSLVTDQLRWAFMNDNKFRSGDFTSECGFGVKIGA